MASGFHTYLKTTRALLRTLDSQVDESTTWVEIDGDAKEDSREFSTYAVVLDFSTSGQMVTIRGWSRGRQVRLLLHTSEMGWAVQGKPLPFEDARALRALRRGGRSPDPYELLAAVLGIGELPPLVDLEAPDSEAAPTPEELAWRSLKLILAADEDNHAAVAKLLGQGVSPNARDPEGRTALHRSLTISMVKRLVAAGAELEAKDQQGRTPLIAALMRNDHLMVEQVDALLAAGASPRARWRGRPCVDALTSPEEAKQRKRALTVVKRLGAVERWRPLRVDVADGTLDATRAAVRKCLKNLALFSTPAQAARWTRGIEASLRNRPEVAHLAG